MLFSSEQLDDYLFCGAYFAYRHKYGIRAGSDAHQKVYHAALREVLLFSVTQRLEFQVTLQNVLDLWEARWQEVATEKGLTSLLKVSYQAKGIATLRAFWQGLDTPVGVAQTLDYTVGRHRVNLVVDVLDSTYTGPGKLLLRATLLRPSVDRLNAPLGRTGITHRLIKRSGDGKFGQDLVFRIFDYSVGRWLVPSQIAKQEEGLEDSIRKTLTGIKNKLFFPKAESADCLKCPYQSFCASKWLTDKRLDDPEGTRAEIASVLRGQELEVRDQEQEIQHA